MTVVKMKAASPDVMALDLSLPHKVADLSLADYGNKEMRLAENQMPGLMAVREKKLSALYDRNHRTTVEWKAIVTRCQVQCFIPHTHGPGPKVQLNCNGFRHCFSLHPLAPAG